MLVGYMRVSSDSDRQSTNLQRDALLAVGVDARHLFEDHASGGRLRKRKKSYAKHRKETRDGQARYGRGSCLPIAQLPLTRNSVSVPAAINTAASPKPTTGETAVHTTPTEALEMNLAAPLTVPSAP